MARVIHLCGLRGSAEGMVVRAAKGTVPRWWKFAGAGRSCREGGLRPSGLALKGKVAALVLTEGSRQPGLQRRRSATRSHGESRAALGEDLLQSVSRLLGSSVRLPECL